MKKVSSVKKTYTCVLIFFIVIVLHSPIYHQHVDDRHPESITHTDNIADHSPNDYSLKSHETSLETKVFTEDTHTTHYHLHFEQTIYYIGRVDTSKVKTISGYTFDAFNNLPMQPLAPKKYSYDYYKSIYYSKNYAKTFSGLSPPQFFI